MLTRFQGPLGEQDVASIDEALREALGAGDDDRIDKQLGRLLRAQKRQPEIARKLVDDVEAHRFGVERGLEILKRVLDDHADDGSLLAHIGLATEGARDIDMLNLAAPEDAFFAALLTRLETVAGDARGTDDELNILSGLATTARMMARQADDVAEHAYRRIVELNPDNSSSHYNLGLFLKTRGRFAEGMQANQHAIGLSDQEQEAYNWNLGICATGAGEADVALAMWRQMGQKIEPGRFDLPEGGYPACKIRLAERPLAERSQDDDHPGLEETIWVERLSPCHGVIRSVLYQELGVDYGDVVLFDGAPITYHKVGDREVPVFPHLATLRHCGYRYYDFAGTQSEAGQLEDLSRKLPADSVIYSHSENFSVICASCWRDPDVDHERHDGEEKHVVTGRIAAPPQVEPRELLAAIDAAAATIAPSRIYAPDLSRDAGEAERAVFEQRRFDMLR